MESESLITNVFPDTGRDTDSRTNNLVLLKQVHTDVNTQSPQSPDITLCYGSVEKGNTSIINLTGTMDINVAPELHDLLSGCVSRRKNIIICMTDVTHFDTAGAATLLEVYAASREIGLAFALVSVSKSVCHILALCRLNLILPEFDKLENAEQYVLDYQKGDNLCSSSTR